MIVYDELGRISKEPEENCCMEAKETSREQEFGIE
jgi:hypothetical protein